MDDTEQKMCEKNAKGKNEMKPNDAKRVSKENSVSGINSVDEEKHEIAGQVEGERRPKSGKNL